MKFKINRNYINSYYYRFAEYDYIEADLDNLDPKIWKAWDDVARVLILPEDIIEKYFYWFKDYSIYVYQTLSEDFIRRNKDILNWTMISWQQKLSENFIEEFKDYVDWAQISAYQDFSDDFIRRNCDYIHWGSLCYYKNISIDIIKEFVEKMDYISLIRNEHISQDIKDYCRMFI